MIKSQTNMGSCAKRSIEILQTKSIKIVIACMLLYSITPLYAAIPWLHVEGNKIKDPAGNVVVLRGVSLIDLGYLEDWHGGAIAAIDRLTDKTDTQGSSPGWYTKVVRIPIVPPDAIDPPYSWPYPFDPNDPNEELYNLLRTVVDYCAQKDLYAIIDWHYVANTYDHVETTSEFWEYMAPKFANDSHVIFELFNEPINDVNDDWVFNDNDTTDWLSVRDDMQTWIDIVRTYAPNNPIIVGGAFYSQLIGPAATYPVSDPVGGNNIIYASHIYPGHFLSWCWSNGCGSSLGSYSDEITTCAAVHPVITTEWGFTSDPDYDDEGHLLMGTVTNYGQPFTDFIEGLQIGNTAWVADYSWGPPMFSFWAGHWILRVGDGEMGGFVKDKLYEKRNDDQPGLGFINFTNFADFAIQWRRTDCGPLNTWCSDADLHHDGSVLLDDLQELAYYWLGGAE